MKQPIDVLNSGSPLSLESLCTTYILEKILLTNGRKIEHCAKTLLQCNDEEEETSIKPRKRRWLKGSRICLPYSWRKSSSCLSSRTFAFTYLHVPHMHTHFRFACQPIRDPFYHQIFNYHSNRVSGRLGKCGLLDSNGSFSDSKFQLQRFSQNSSILFHFGQFDDGSAT